MAEASSSSVVSVIPRSPPGPQVFTSFRGKDVRKSFVSFLVPALKDKNINVFIDDQEERGKFLISLFERISQSKLALVIFSEGYTESKWCLDELVKIKECMDQKKLIVIPIFYKLDPSKVKGLRGKFGDRFRDIAYRYRHEPERCHKWTEALTSVSQTFAMSLSKYSDKSDQDFISSIVMEVKKVLLNISKGINGENDDNFSVPGRKLTITAYEEPNEEVVEVPVLNNVTENLQMRNQSLGPLYEVRNQSLGPLYEFKYWDFHRPNGNVFIINARDLSIEWSENPKHWTWLPLPNQNPNETVEAAFLRKASWLDLAGTFDTRYLTPWTKYEVVFAVKLENATLAWERPVKLKLVLHNNRKKTLERSVDMVDYMSKQWVDILVGEFTTSRKNIGEISFAMYEHECQLWKAGLFVKGVVIRPKS